MATVFISTRHGMSRKMTDALQWVSLGDHVTAIKGGFHSEIHFCGTVENFDMIYDAAPKGGDVVFVKNAHKFYMNVPDTVVA